jgi:hypothetical protein
LGDLKDISRDPVSEDQNSLRTVPDAVTLATIFGGRSGNGYGL